MACFINLEKHASEDIKVYQIIGECFNRMGERFNRMESVATGRDGVLIG